jgi:hypothetical protein
MHSLLSCQGEQIEPAPTPGTRGGRTEVQSLLIGISCCQIRNALTDNGTRATWTCSRHLGQVFLFPKRTFAVIVTL